MRDAHCRGLAVVTTSDQTYLGRRSCLSGVLLFVATRVDAVVVPRPCTHVEYPLLCDTSGRGGCRPFCPGRSRSLVTSGGFDER